MLGSRVLRQLIDLGKTVAVAHVNVCVVVGLAVNTAMLDTGLCICGHVLQFWGLGHDVTCP